MKANQPNRATTLNCHFCRHGAFPQHGRKTLITCSVARIATNCCVYKCACTLVKYAQASLIELIELRLNDFTYIMKFLKIKFDNFAFLCHNLHTYIHTRCCISTQTLCVERIAATTSANKSNLRRYRYFIRPSTACSSRPRRKSFRELEQRCNKFACYLLKSCSFCFPHQWEIMLPSMIRMHTQTHTLGALGCNKLKNTRSRFRSGNRQFANNSAHPP